MAYKALYRTYRPQKFSDVIGQYVIVKTLQNAIKNDRVSHAYLFCGPRGTGKTSVARIFAKVLNCPNALDGEPCNNCEACKEISEGTCPDVIEIDAASNNGVDEIRDLKEKVKFLPAGSKYKIYIIDEVHMLTQSAFNALLKTLEEPPKHVIFILATTEPQKVISTIISRCQRFDFGTLSVNELVEALVNICEKENIKYDENALKTIASASEGGLRDAISLLDQAISLSQDVIDENVASSVTGLVGKEKLIELANAIEEQKISDCLTLVQDLENSGKEVSKIVSSLLGFYHDILVYKSINLSPNEKYIAFSNRINIDKLYYNIDTLSNVQSRIRFGTNTSIYLEVAIIKLASVSKEELDYNKRIQDLEEKINNGSVQVSSESTPMESHGSINAEYNKKVLILEERFNRVVNKLKEMKLSESMAAVKNLEDKLSIENNKDNQIKELSSKIDNLLMDVNLIKQQQEAFRNKLDNTKAGEVDESTLAGKIEEVLKKTKGSVDIEEVKAYVNQALENYEPKAENKEENDEIIERLSKVESNVYKILAGKLSQQPTQKKSKPKVDERQISMFFSDEIVNFDDINSDKVTPKTDFKELANEEVVNEDIIQEGNEEIVEENNFVEENEDKTLAETLDLNQFQEQKLVEDNKEETFEEDKSLGNEEEITDYVEEDQGLSYFGETEFGANEDDEEEVEENNNLSWYTSNPEETNKITTEETNNDEFVEEEVIDFDNEESIENEPYEEKIVLDETQKETPPVNEEVVYDVQEETPIEEPVIEETVQEQEEPIEEKPNLDELLDEYERFDVKVLERIMYKNYYGGNNRNKYFEYADRIKKIINEIPKNCSPEQRGVAEMLAEGELKLCGDLEFILTYDSAFVCNRVMSRKFKNDSLRLLKDALGDNFNYIAIPEKDFIEKKSEFAMQYNSGYSNPRLTPINNPELKVSLEEDDNEDDVTTRIQSLFGNDVKIKNDSED